MDCWFSSNLVRNLLRGHPTYCKSSWSRGQRSRSQRDVREQRLAKLSIIQPEIVRFRSNFVQTWTYYTDILQKFKVNRLKVKVTAWHDISEAKIVRCHERIERWLSLNSVKLLHSIAQHVTHVQGHKVKYWNRHNYAADCLILLKFGTAFDKITVDTVQLLRRLCQVWCRSTCPLLFYSVFTADTLRYAVILTSDLWLWTFVAITTFLLHLVHE